MHFNDSGPCIQVRGVQTGIKNPETPNGSDCKCQIFPVSWNIDAALYMPNFANQIGTASDTKHSAGEPIAVADFPEMFWNLWDGLRFNCTCSHIIDSVPITMRLPILK